jgi:hypothetical protein
MNNLFVKSNKEIFRYAQNDTSILSLRVPIYQDEAIPWKGWGLSRSRLPSSGGQVARNDK